MRFRVRYTDPDELLGDAEQQLGKGGFLVRVTPSEVPALFSEVEVILEHAEVEVALDGQVLQVIPGVGVAVALKPGTALEPLVAAARARTGAGGAPAVHGVEETAGPHAVEETAGPDDVQGARSRPAPTAEAHVRVQEAGKADRIKMARYGNKTERMLIARGNDPALLRFVLNNPGLGLDEVRAIASMPTVAVEALKTIAERSEWAGRPEIALALVRNPKTPVPIAIKLLAKVSAGDLRQLAKTSKLRMPILQAARKRVVGG